MGGKAVFLHYRVRSNIEIGLPIFRMKALLITRH